MHFYIEPGVVKSNYQFLSQNIDTIQYKKASLYINYNSSSKLKYTLITLPIGVQASMFKNFYLNFKWQYYIFLGGAKLNGFAFGIGYKFLDI